jgi:DNA-binding protein HU-beta
MSERMGKAHMVQVIAEKAGITRKQAGVAFDALLDEIVEGVREGSVSLPGLGTFSIVHTQARIGVRPGTTQRINIAASSRLKFKASSALKGKYPPPPAPEPEPEPEPEPVKTKAVRKKKAS